MKNINIQQLTGHQVKLVTLVDLRSKLNTLLIWLNNELDTSFMGLLGLFYC
jgi:predicted mannosyl-3-phosphoglycerate phosphatase (HAD superfamily)